MHLVGLSQITMQDFPTSCEKSHRVIEQLNLFWLYNDLKGLLLVYWHLTTQVFCLIFLLLLTNSWQSKQQLELHSHTNIPHSPLCLNTGISLWNGVHSILGKMLQWRDSEYVEYQEQIRFRKCLLKFHSEYFTFLSTNAD